MPKDVRDTRIFQLSQKLNQRLSQRGHDVGRVVEREASNQFDGDDPIFEHLVVQRDKERAHILGLREVFVEPLMQRLEDSPADRSV